MLLIGLSDTAPECPSTILLGRLAAGRVAGLVNSPDIGAALSHRDGYLPELHYFATPCDKGVLN